MTDSGRVSASKISCRQEIWTRETVKQTDTPFSRLLVEHRRKETLSADQFQRGEQHLSLLVADRFGKCHHPGSAVGHHQHNRDGIAGEAALVCGHLRSDEEPNAFEPSVIFDCERLVGEGEYTVRNDAV